MTTYAAEEEELVELEDDLQARKRQIADSEMSKAMGREGRMVDISDDPEIDTLWSMVDGQRITIPHFMTARTLRKRLPSGERAFTSDPRRAPKLPANHVLCWLHRNHDRRSEWDQMGLAGMTCEAAHLASPYSARIHMQHRHKNEWAAIEEYVNQQREETNRSMAQKQLDATLALASRAAGNPQPQVATVSAPAATVPDSLVCECGWTTPEGKQPKQSLAFHKRLHCPLNKKEE